MWQKIKDSVVFLVLAPVALLFVGLVVVWKWIVQDTGRTAIPEDQRTRNEINEIERKSSEDLDAAKRQAEAQKEQIRREHQAATSELERQSREESSEALRRELLRGASDE